MDRRERIGTKGMTAELVKGDRGGVKIRKSVMAGGN